MQKGERSIKAVRRKKKEKTKMETFDKVAGLIAEQLGKDKSEIRLDSDIVKDLGADSLDVVQMLMALEDEYGITVSEDDAAGLKTVGDIVNIIDKK